jgi:twitching motility protein PilJ
VLAAVLLAAAAALWRAPAGPAGGGTVELGRLVALTQAARTEARAALGGEADGLPVLARTRAELESERQNLLSREDTPAPIRDLAADGQVWTALGGGLDRILESHATLAAVNAARDRLLELLPQLLAATVNLAGALTPEDLAANQTFLDRFELTVEGMQQLIRNMGAGASVDESARRLNDAQQLLGQIIDGLSGADASLGLTPVGEAAAPDLEKASMLLAETRAEIGSIAAAGGTVNAMQESARQFETAARELLDRYRTLDVGGSVSPLVERLPLWLVLAALLVLGLMMVAYYRARDFRRAADIQAAQNERNQQAILRLLDELSSLADGDLTVQATVTEDITGAIADSINYAIEALRELVATINDTSILVDAAAKQTEATARQLVRSSETHTKQAASASDSIAQMAMSIEEVSGNAERCADVARHAVDVAHKGGEAVRRTIQGMNTIRETIQDTSKRIKRLGESSQEIGNIVELIEEIAEQTNILALNASIEASRAGEASRGFAVVADEVQKLAERSTNATKKIEVLVSTIQSDTNEAVVSMERSTTDVVGGALLAENAGAALDEIEQVSHQIASLVQNISGSAREQAGVSSAITRNMQVLREISSKTTESTSATSSSISKLSELASELRKTVSGFRLPDHVTGTGVLSQTRVAASLRRSEEAAPPEELAQVLEQRRQSG